MSRSDASQLQTIQLPIFHYTRKTAYSRVYDGWYNMIDEFYDALEKHNDNPDNVKIIVNEVKPKWGMLRIYYSPSNKNIDEIYGNIQKKSISTCEICGNIGTTIDIDRMLYILCDEHSTTDPMDYFN